MIRIQILNVTVPSTFQDPGGVFLDIGDTDLSLNRTAEELNEINEIRYGGVRRFTVPATGKNKFIFRQFIAATPIDFDYTPLECRIYVGSVAIEETKIGASRMRESDKQMELLATKANDYWLIGAMSLRLPQIPYEDIEFTKANIEANWAANYEYADGDIGINFTPMYFGTPYRERMMTVEYMRWTYHLLRLYREGFRLLGWVFKCEALESTQGRRIAAYLIDPNAYSRDDLIEANKATAESGEINRERNYRISGGGIGPLGGLFGTLLGGEKVYAYDFVVIHETITYDPGTNIINGRYNGFGVFRFTVTIQYIPEDIRSKVVRVTFYLNNPPTTTSPAGKPTAVYEEEFQPLNDLVGDPTAVQEKVIEAEISMQVNQSITVSIYAESTHKTIKIQNTFLRVTPLQVYPQRGETINPADYLRNDTLLEALKGWVHVMRGKLDIIPGEKTIQVMPNDGTDFLGATLEGYYRDTLIDVTPIQVKESSIVESPVSKPNRYQLIRFKQSTDPSVDKLGLDKLTPLWSKTVDLGEQYKPEYTEYANPYFEPTLNDWVYDFSPEGKEHLPINLPMLLDHIPDKNSVQMSLKIGPRIMLLVEPNGQIWETESGVLIPYLGWEDTEVGAWNYGFQRNFFSSTANQLNLVFDDGPLFQAEQTLYVVFWRNWIFRNIVSSKINILAVIQGSHYFGWSFRDAYKIIVRGKGEITSLVSIDDFNPRSGASTPVNFIPRGTMGVVSDNTVDPCDSYSYDLVIARTGSTWNFSIVTDNPDGGTIEWRYEGTPTWTTGTSVVDPTGPFFVRYTQTSGDCTRTIVKYVNPCSDNMPTILIDYELAANGDNCVTGTLGGILADPVLSTNIQYDLDSAGTWPAYTLGTQICGSFTLICFRGTVEFDNSCDDYEIPPVCYEIPPNQDCLANAPEVLIIHDGLDSFRFDMQGTWDSEIGSFHFFYKHIGEDEKEAKRWTDFNPIVGTDYEVRLHVFWCDDCPPYCGPWTPVVDPMALMTKPQALMAATGWDFSKIPENKRSEVVDLINRGERAALVRLHNNYNISEYEYCCGDDLNQVFTWFKWGLDNDKF